MAKPTSTAMRPWPCHRLAKGLLRIGIDIGSAATFADLADDIWRRQSFAWDVPLMPAVHHGSRPWLDLFICISSWPVRALISVRRWLWNTASAFPAATPCMASWRSSCDGSGVGAGPSLLACGSWSWTSAASFWACIAPATRSAGSVWAFFCMSQSLPSAISTNVAWRASKSRTTG